MIPTKLTVKNGEGLGIRRGAAVAVGQFSSGALLIPYLHLEFKQIFFGV